MIILYHKYLFHVKWIIFSINCRKIFGYNKIMCTFAYTFCLAGKGWLDAKAELLGFKAVRQQKCQVRTHLHQKTLPQAESYFFMQSHAQQSHGHCGRKIKSGTLATCKIPDFPFFCHCDPQQLILQTSASSVTDFGKFHRQLILSRNMSSNRKITLSVFVHVIIVAEVLPAGHVVKPWTILKVPADGLLDTFRELKARLHIL